MSTLEGQTLGNYRIEALLGTGGMGEVYRAVHVRLNRAAAIKVMHAYLATDPTFQARFLREAQSAAALSHPHIVEVFDFGEEDERSFLVMELVPDGSLRTLMRQRSAESGWSLALGLDLVSQAAEGLAYAHQHGMVHRDIKPDNLLLHHRTAARTGHPSEPSEHYDLKISDFGLARLAESGGDLTVTGMVVGTPAYMSPEQCQGEHLDARSDLYSLGVVLYEVATGSLPFRVKTLSEAVFKHVSASPPPPRQVRPDLPEELEEVILRCLAKQPEDRFASAADLTRALHGALSDTEMVTLVAAPGTEQPPRFSTPQVAADTPLQSPAARDSRPPQAVSTPPKRSKPTPLPSKAPQSVAKLPESPAKELAPVAAAPTPLPAASDPPSAAVPDRSGSTSDHASREASDDGASLARPSLDISAVWNSVVARSGALLSGVTSTVSSTVSSTVEHVRPSLASAAARAAGWAKRRPRWHWGLAGAAVVVVLVMVIVFAGSLQARPRTAVGNHPTAHSAAKATSTAKATATVRATATPPPAATATPVEAVKGNYPLTSPTSGWPALSQCSFTNGGYTVSGEWICYAPGGQLGDATYSVRAHMLSGPTDQFYGVVLRSVQDGRYYFFGINASQQWTFSLSGNGAGDPIVTPTTDTHIQPGLNASNTLTVRARGSQFTFYVNGAEVGTANNAVLSAGSFGLTDTASNLKVVYNDFVITVPA